MSVEKTLSSYIVGLQHVGHIVEDLDASVAAFRRLYGLDEASIRREPAVDDGSAASLFAFVTVGDAEFELIEARSPEFREQLGSSPVGGAGINHVAWRVTDITACVALLAAQGIHPGHVTPDGIVEFGDRKLVYLDPTDTGGLLVELLEIRPVGSA
jgi:catechol 2,3-dioxygenase-like lactoylglutathione lyase family enzyme